MVAPLMFGNGWVISSHTLQQMYFSHAELIHVSERGHWKIKRVTGALMNDICVTVKPDSYIGNDVLHGNTMYGDEYEWYMRYRVYA